jgi:hypothetical protein
VWRIVPQGTIMPAMQVTAVTQSSAPVRQVCQRSGELFSILCELAPAGVLDSTSSMARILESRG